MHTYYRRILPGGSIAVTTLLLLGTACPSESAQTSETSATTESPPSTGAVESTGSTGGATDGASGSTTAPTSGETTMAPPAVCGDGVVAPEEVCDDGNDVAEDGCDANCQRTAAIVWTTTYNGEAGKGDYGRGVAIDKTGRIVIVGNEHDAMGWSQMLLLVLDADGKQLWKKTIPGEAMRHAVLSSVALGDDGTIYAGGWDEIDDVSSRAIFRSFAPDGKDGWTFSEPAPTTGFAAIQAVQFAGGALYTVGQEALADTGGQMVARKHTLADGAAAWKTVHQGERTWAFGRAVAVTGGEIVAAGGAGDKSNLSYPLIVRLDAAGAVTSFSVDDKGDAGAWFGASPIGPDGDVVLAGRYSPPGNTFFDFTVSRVGPDGAVKWIDYKDGTQVFDQANGVAVGPDEGVFAAGGLTIVGELSNVFVRRYEGDGAIRWSSSYDNTDISLDDAAFGVAYGPDFLVAVGYTLVQGEGANVWVRRFGID